MSMKINPKTGHSNFAVVLTTVCAVVMFAVMSYAFLVIKDEKTAGMVGMGLAASLVLPFSALTQFFINRRNSK